jgi:D-3-phosphoglycerate dehydrogenase
MADQNPGGPPTVHTVITCLTLHPAGMALLEARQDIAVRHLPQPSPAELQAAIGGATAVLVGLEPVNEALLAHADALSIVARFGVGYDLVDIPACSRRGIAVGVTNGGNDLAVAEHTLMLLLSVARRVIEHDASVRAGTWMRPQGRPMGELAGRTVLVVGYGRIGTRVARLCAAFGMRVMVHDPAFPLPRIAADGYIAVPDLAAALPEVDVLTLHCPSSETTRRMINAEMLSLMKPTAWLINAARGALVDESALIDALRAGRLEAAGLDVLVQEPPDTANPLLGMANVVLSPHNAAAPIECFEKMSIRAARNIIERIDGTLDASFVVNPEALPNRRNA